MTQSWLSRLTPFAIAILAVACNGTTANQSIPTAPTGAPAAGGPGCTPAVTGLPTLVQAPGGSFPFGIAIGPGCGWTAQTDVTWADVSPSTGEGTTQSTLDVEANPNVDARSFLVTVSGQSFQVIQVSGCSYTVNPSSLELGGEAGSTTISVVATIGGCPWTATSGESWLRVLSPSGSGTSTIGLDFDSNPGGERHTFLMIAGQRINVTQASL